MDFWHSTTQHTTRFSTSTLYREHYLSIPVESMLTCSRKYTAGGLNLDPGHFGQLSGSELISQIADPDSVCSCSHVSVPDRIPVLLLPVSRALWLTNEICAESSTETSGESSPVDDWTTVLTLLEALPEADSHT